MSIFWVAVVSVYAAAGSGKVIVEEFPHGVGGVYSVELSEGNYNVTITFGGTAEKVLTTVKGESRRLMLENVESGGGVEAERKFTVNIRRPEIAGGGAVKLKAREKNYLHWDNKLSLEFLGNHQAVRKIKIEAVDDAITVFLAGDSTVTDQPREPYSTWGAMLPRFFKAGVAVANHAESGESLKSSLGAHRFDKIYSQMKAGDYLFVQFGHNDQKDKNPGQGAFEGYKERLKKVIEETKKHGGIPVLVTSMNRRNFDASGKIVSNLGDFPEAVRQTAKEENVALIDLHAMSAPFYEGLEAKGHDESKKAFAPGDNSHHNNYGGYELAKYVVEGIRKCGLGLAKFIVDDWKPFDPAHPDPIEEFRVPASEGADTRKPDGN